MQASETPRALIAAMVRSSMAAIASAPIGLAPYFVGAVIAHLRVGDGLADIAIPLGYIVVMSASAALCGATVKTDGQPRSIPDRVRPADASTSLHPVTSETAARTMKSTEPRRKQQ